MKDSTKSSEINTKVLTARQILDKSALILVAAVITRSMPILVGIYVVRFYGEVAFKSFSLLLVAITLALVIITAGVCPSLIRAITITKSRRQRRFLVGNFLAVSSVSSVFASIIVLSRYGSVAPLQIDLIFVFLMIAAILGTTVYLIAITTLQTIDRAFVVVVLGIGHAIVCAVLMISQPADYETFARGYLFAYFLLGLASYVFLHFSVCRPAIRSRLRAWKEPFSYVLSNTSSIFLANITWMAGIFAYHSWLAGGGVTTSEYILFGIGYQWFGILIFIPGALSPVLIPLFLKAKSIQLLILSTLCFLVIDLFVIFLLLYDGLVLERIYGMDTLDQNLQPLYFALLAGAIASMNAPISQYLFSRGLTGMIMVASALWCVLIWVVIEFGGDTLVFAAFPIAYASSVLVLGASALLYSADRRSVAAR